MAGLWANGGRRNAPNAWLDVLTNAYLTMEYAEILTERSIA